MAFVSRQDASENSHTGDLANIVRVTCVAWLATLLLSWPAYIRDARIFKLSPVLKILDAAPAWVDWPLLVINIGFLIGLAVKPRQRFFAFGALACAVFWVLQDLLRFQPFLYMYFFTILLAVFFEAGGLNALKIMTGSVYFWAGFHKFNVTFFLNVFPWFIAPFYEFSRKPSLTGLFMIILILAVPAFEATIGILLLFFPKRRRIATLMAFIMLVVVLACLGPVGHKWNMIVWPWNIYLFLLELILFYKPARADEGIQFQLNAPTLAAAAFFSVAPALTLFGWWPFFPSFKLYSGNVGDAEIILAQDEDAAHLPKNLGQLVDREHKIWLFEWTLREFGMAAYPESAVFRQGAKGLCPYLSDARNATLRIYDAPAFYSLYMNYRDFPLCPDEMKICPVE